MPTRTPIVNQRQLLKMDCRHDLRRVHPSLDGARHGHAARTGTGLLNDSPVITASLHCDCQT